MKRKIGPSEGAPSQERQGDVFDPITKERLLVLRDGLKERIGLDLEELPIHVSNPGEFYFDLYEAQTKLYQKIGDWKKCVSLLIENGYSFSPLAPDADKQMQTIAESHGVVLDGSMPGFVYNVSGRMIIYMGIKEENVISMAEKYAEKENDENRHFSSPELAKDYLSHLAEKYFYHEVGHTVYSRMLDPKEKEVWREMILANEKLVQKIIEIQTDKHPNPESIPIPDEAFADIFAELTDDSGNSNRLGGHQQERDLALRLLKELGLEI